MEGTVILVNRQKSFIGIDVDGQISIIELLGDYSIEINDILSGEFRSLGADEIYNITQKEEMDVYIQDIHSSKHKIKDLTNY